MAFRGQYPTREYIIPTLVTAPPLPTPSLWIVYIPPEQTNSFLDLLLTTMLCESEECTLPSW